VFLDANQFLAMTVANNLSRFLPALGGKICHLSLGFDLSLVICHYIHRQAGYCVLFPFIYIAANL